MKLTSSMNYFQKILYNDLHKKICHYLNFHYKPKGSFVFMEGQQPDNFYIIVRGSVAVFISIPLKEFQQKSLPMYNIFMKHIPEFSNVFTEIANKQKRKEFTIRSLFIIRFFQKMILKVCLSLKYLRYTKTAIEQRKISQQSRSPLRRKKTNKFASTIQKIVSLKGLFEEAIYQSIETIFNQINKGIRLNDIQYQFRLFKGNVLNLELTTIYREGYSFGELGFINKQTRDATVLTLEDTIFGILDQRGYENSVVESDQKRIKKNITFIKDVLFPPELVTSSEKLSRISYFFQKTKFNLTNHIFHQLERMQFVHIIFSGEVEISKCLKFKSNNQSQEIKIQIIGNYEFIDDADYFENSLVHTFSAKVVSNKCKIFQIKKENFDRILKENKDVHEYLRRKFLTKKQFVKERIDKFVDVRTKFLVKKDFVLQTSQTYYSLKSKKDDFLNMIDSLPQNKASQIHNIVIKNKELQKKQGADQIDSRELFLLTKKIGNFQLALRNYKNGKHINFDIDYDEIKMRNLVNLRLGRKYSQAPATERNINYHKGSFFQDSSEQPRSYNLIKSLDKHIETETIPELKSTNIHLSQLKQEQQLVKNLKFKSFNIKENKFQQHLKEDSPSFTPQQSFSRSIFSQIGHKISFHQRKNS